jgi:hypothetical protein
VASGMRGQDHERLLSFSGNYAGHAYEQAQQMIVKCEYEGSSLPDRNGRVPSAAHPGVREISSEYCST